MAWWCARRGARGVVRAAWCARRGARARRGAHDVLLEREAIVAHLEAHVRRGDPRLHAAALVVALAEGLQCPLRVAARVRQVTLLHQPHLLLEVGGVQLVAVVLVDLLHGVPHRPHCRHRAPRDVRIPVVRRARDAA
eukprot:7234698-Prymnesium_polylepis.1